ncbi:MAG: ATP-binding cassette domain-containing protein [Christensenellales bacterium]
MLELNDISLTIGGNPILKNISLQLDLGKIYVITGPNGSGKSSLARVIMGIDTPDKGTVVLDGQDITNLDITRRARLGIGYAFQHPPRFKGIKVSDLLKLSVGEGSRKVWDLLYSVGLCSRDYLERDVDATLSGGEIKRIEIATVLARNLKVAVFDEPEAGIDLWSFQKLAETFKQMHERLSTTIIIISHQERILELADEIMLINNGGIRRNVACGDIYKPGVRANCECSENCGKVEVKDAQCIG